MRIISSNAIKKVEAVTCTNQSISHLELIKRAAGAFVKYFEKKFPQLPQQVQILCGNGNNGADGIHIANGLASLGYDVQVVLIRVTPSSSSEFIESKNLLFQSVSVIDLTNSDLDQFIPIQEGIIIDGLIGAGLSRPLESKMAVFIDGINSVNCVKIAIDLPTGMHGDKGLIGPTLKCNYTVGLGSAKMGYFLHGSADFTGQLTILDIHLEILEVNEEAPQDQYLTPSFVRSLLHPATPTAHKYQRGHCFILGGKYGMAGCMKLAGEAALRSGCGLITLHVPAQAVNFLQASLPEAILQADKQNDTISEFHFPEKFDACCIGPGMGTTDASVLVIQKMLDELPGKPVVWDADALNVFATHPEWLTSLPPGSILTPHKGEFERLLGSSSTPEDLLFCLRSNAIKYQCHIVLKGAHTMIANPNGNISINCSGHWGMATAGSGDVLSGMIASLLAQGYNTDEASILGVYLHGLAGEIAAARYSPYAMIASDIIKCIGSAYISLMKY